MKSNGDKKSSLLFYFHISVYPNFFIMKYAYLILFISLMISCGDNNPEITNPDDPSNLTLDIFVYEDESGTVVINALAENTVEYHFFMDDGSEDPVIKTTGDFEYTYPRSGNYDIAVRAYGPSGRYLTKEKRVFVLADEPVDIGAGYSTPITYPDMTLVWNDEFDGQVLDSDDWSYDIGDGCPNLCGWGNNELEYYREQNVWLDDGRLTIEAREETFGGRFYTSGKIVTRGKQAVQYGRVDIRATLPKGQGLWPALWMLGTNQPSVGWPKCGEIDIMEMKGGSGRENTVSANVFYSIPSTTYPVDQPKTYTLDEGTFADEFHVFSIIWDEQEIKWFVDDVEYHSFSITPADRDEFKKPFYIIMNVAVGGDFPGSPDNTTIFPTRMQVDYIRVFQDN